MRICNLPIVTAIAILVSTIAQPRSGFGGSLTDEVMMEVQSLQHLLIESANTWNVTDSVSYNYRYDMNTGAFSFSTEPGQSIGGQSFFTSTDARFDSASGIWSWFGTGHVGQTNFQIAGNATDPPETIDIKGVYTDDKDHDFTVTAKVTVTETIVGGRIRKESSGTGEAKNSKGVVIKSGKLTDIQRLDIDQKPPTETWEVTFIAEGVQSKLIGTGSGEQIEPFVFQGTFTQSVSVPEPASLSLISMGAMGLILANAIRHRRVMNRNRSRS